MRLILDFVTVNPEWIVGSGGHSECSDVLLICVVERAHVVWNIKAELVLLVKEYIVNCHRTFQQVIWKMSVFNLKHNIFINTKRRLSEVVCECEKSHVGSIWIFFTGRATFNILNPREHDSLQLSVPNCFWALWVTLSILWMTYLLLDIPWASSVLYLSIEDVDGHSVTMRRGVRCVFSIIVLSINFCVNFCLNLG